MTTRPTLSSYPEDAELWKWTKDVEGFVEDLIGSNRVPSAPAQVKVVPQSNSVKVTFRAVNEVGVSEYNIYRGTDKNFTGRNSELIATVTQAIDPSGTDIVYTDVEAVEKSYYFVSAVKGLRRPRLEGPVAGFGSATTGHAIGEDLPGGTIAGFDGIPGSILFVNEDSLINQDNENFFYSEMFNAMVVGNAGLMWGPQKSPDITLIRDAADILALRRGANDQRFRVYEDFTAAGGGAAITQTLLLAEADPVDRQVYVTASISPTPNKLILIFITGTDFGFNSPILMTSVTGAGLTWEQVAEVQMDTIAGPRQTFACYRALGPGATPGALSITFDGSAALGQWIIVEFDNIDTSGTNGSGAIVQVATNVSDSAISLAATLAAFSDLNNATVGGFGCGAGGTPTWTPGNGFIEIAESTGEDRVSMVQFRNDNDTSVDATLSTTSDIAVIALEIKNAVAAGGLARYIEMAALGASGAAEVMAVTGAGDTDRDLVVGTRGSADFLFYTNNTEVGRFTFDGLFSIGPSEDVILRRESAGILSLVDPGSNIAGGVQQEFRIYSYDFTGETRYLQLFADRSGNGEAEIWAKRAEGGGQYDLRIGVDVGRIAFHNEATERWNIQGSVTGAFEFAPFVTNTYDLGTALLGVRNLYTNGVLIGQDQTAAYDAITIDGTDLTGDGQQDSGAIIMTGLGFETATPHDADWKIFVDITTNAAASIWTLQTRIDAAGFADRVTIVDTGLMSVFGNLILPAADLGNDLPGRCVTIERNSHVADEGPAPGSVELEAADGVSAFLWVDDDGDIRIHTAKATGSTGAPTVDANTAGFKISPLKSQHFHFASRLGSFGVEFSAGGYTFSTADANLTQASTTVAIGTANHPYYAHAFLVAAAAGAASGGAGEVEIEVSGTSIDDNGVRSAADTEILVADITAMATDQYFETAKKWIGTVTYTLQVAGGGTHTTFNADFNYGLAKYEDFSNMDFEIAGFELTGRAGAVDTSFNVELCLHQATGWTYAATGFVAGSFPALVDVAAILSTESDLAAGEEFAFKKLDIATQVAGSGSEGYVIRVTTGANASVETMNMTVSARLN